MCFKMSRSSESGNSTNSESSIDINTLEENTHHRDTSDKVSNIPKVMAPSSFGASSAKSLAFSISRLLGPTDRCRVGKTRTGVEAP